MRAEPSNFSKLQVDSLAEEAYEYFNPIANTLESIVVNNFDGEIIYKPLDELYESGSLLVVDKKPKIYVNSYEPYYRIRFTIAHELGHFILHSDFGEKPIKVHRSGEDERVEWEANWFAAGFLMPKTVFKEKYNVTRDVLSLSSFFEVSTSSIEYRIKFLKDIRCLS